MGESKGFKPPVPMTLSSQQTQPATRSMSPIATRSVSPKPTPPMSSIETKPATDLATKFLTPLVTSSTTPSPKSSVSSKDWWKWFLIALGAISCVLIAVGIRKYKNRGQQVDSYDPEEDYSDEVEDPYNTLYNTVGTNDQVNHNCTYPNDPENPNEANEKLKKRNVDLKAASNALGNATSNNKNNGVTNGMTNFVNNNSCLLL